MQVNDKVRVIGTDITGTVVLISEETNEADVRLDHPSNAGPITHFFLDELEVVE